ncbi:hypothetical protein FE257_001735 [Aspergillus nanangensis]|uniref:Alcohol acetyltransferase n=1 Tax=Aspergillus nanangensis TaxID=2582783 RepID=A0AAD4GNR9_ASPNN|nr:hypothetical protein FE257_001735 [Aspergillus nanangensis]
MDNYEKLRPVGLIEKYSTARNHLGFYYNVVVAATYTLPATFTLPIQDYIYKGCEVLIGQHPALSALPLGEDTNEPYWVRLPEVDLSQAVHFQKRTQPIPETDKDTELEKLLQDQHNTPFMAPHPYWRLCVLTDEIQPQRFTAAFVYHHAVGDGTSGKAFHENLLPALRSAVSLAPGEAKQIIPSPQSPLLPSLEEAHPLPISFLYLITALFKAKVWSPKNPRLWSGADMCQPLTTQVRYTVLPANLATSFRKICRQNNTTITAALASLIARAIFQHTPKNFTQVQASIPIAMRRWLPDNITNKSIGVWVQDCSESYDRNVVVTKDSSFPWDEAKRSRQSLEKALKLQGTDADVGLLKYVDDFFEFFKSKVGKPRESSFELSNVGPLVVEGAGDSAIPQIGHVVFSQCGSVTGSALEVSAVLGGDGCLSLAFSWQEGVVEAELVTAVMETIRIDIHQVCAN